MNNVVKVKNLNFKYSSQKKDLLKDVSFEISKQDFVGIVGGNGSGKSTLLKLILGLLKPNSGKVKLFEKTPSEARDRVGYLSQFEDIDFDFPITAYSIVLSGTIKANLINKHTKEDHQKAQETMRHLGAWDLKEENLKDLSGGQKQKVFLARALVNDPELLILDEPLMNLDIKSQTDLYELLKKLNKKITIIVVDHNIEILIEYADKIICIDKCEKNSIKLHHENLKHLAHKV
jgi:zinc transport system ATP-binding protein